MKFISYSQNFEDVMLFRALKKIDNGFYVDVGAQHPITDSVTAAFYERGWSGINIDAVEHWYQLLKDARPRDTNLNMLIGRSTSEQEFYTVDATGLSTTDANYAAQYTAEGFSVSRTSLQTFTLNDILKRHSPTTIHFLKIDVEGAEGDVLAGLDLQVYRPWIMLIEAYKPRSTEADFDSWEPSLIASDYHRVYDDGLNRYYVANEQSHLDAYFQLPPNVNDDFETHEMQWLRNDGQRWRTEYEEAMRAFDLSGRAENLLDTARVIAEHDQSLQDHLANQVKLYDGVLAKLDNVCARLAVIEKDQSDVGATAGNLEELQAGIATGIRTLSEDLTAIDKATSDRALSQFTSLRNELTGIYGVIEENFATLRKDATRTIEQMQERVSAFESAEATKSRTLAGYSDNFDSANAAVQRSLQLLSEQMISVNEQSNERCNAEFGSLNKVVLNVAEKIDKQFVLIGDVISKQWDGHLRSLSDDFVKKLQAHVDRQAELSKRLDMESRSVTLLKDAMQAEARRLEIAEADLARVIAANDSNVTRVSQLEADNASKARTLENIRNDRAAIEIKYEESILACNEAFAVSAAAHTEISRLHAEIELRNVRIAAQADTILALEAAVDKLRSERSEILESLVDAETDLQHLSAEHERLLATPLTQHISEFLKGGAKRNPAASLLDISQRPRRSLDFEFDENSDQSINESDALDVAEALHLPSPEMAGDSSLPDTVNSILVKLKRRVNSRSPENDRQRAE